MRGLQFTILCQKKNDTVQTAPLSKLTLVSQLITFLEKKI